jgi:uncharacterized protein YdhG (YjbR/CyaY superfamily)
MATKKASPRNVDEYIAAFPHDVQEILQRIRRTVRSAAPRAEEKISYRIPAYAFHGELVYFAAFAHHIGLYPPAKGDRKFKQEIAPYVGEKGNLKLPLDQPIPYSLIRRFVEFRVKEKLASPKTKRARRPSKSN